MDSEYALVAKIDHRSDGSQRLGAIWMLFNYRPFTEDGDGKRYANDLGYGVPGDESHYLRSGFKIADSYEQLGAQYAIPLPYIESVDSINIHFELVACFRLPGSNRIVRQFEQSVVREPAA
jgi:hypothetical protein